jgi:hypothetical protein
VDDPSWAEQTLCETLRRLQSSTVVDGNQIELISAEATGDQLFELRYRSPWTTEVMGLRVNAVGASFDIPAPYDMGHGSAPDPRMLAWNLVDFLIGEPHDESFYESVPDTRGTYWISMPIRLRASGR